MKKLNLFIIGVILLFIIFSAAYIYSQNSSKVTTGTKRPKYCDINPDDPSCLNLIQCGLLDKDTIKSCENNENICSNCQCTSDPSVKMNCMTCTPSDGTFEVSVNKKGCQDPFIWNEQQGKCFLKKGKFCLPTDLNPNIHCSSYTGNKVLTQKDENSPIQWKCVCKDTTKFVNSIDDNGNCIGVNICNMQGHSNPKDISVSKRALIKKDSKSNPVLWDGTNFNPLTESECKCLGDEQFDAENMTCKKSSCSPNGVNDPNNPLSCLCGPGFVSCHIINNLNGVDLNICTSPSCVPDPCTGEGDAESLTNRTIRTANGEGFECSCDKDKGFFPFSNKNSAWGTCVKLCSPQNSPCADRGTCFVLDENLGNITKYNFKYVSNLSKWQITTIYQNKEYSFNIGTNSSLVMTQSTEVFFKIYSGADKTFSKNIRNGLTNGQNYIVQMFKNDTPLGYIDFMNKKIVSTLPDITGNEPEKNKDFIFTYTSFERDENIGSIKIEYDTNLKKYNYLNFNGTNLFVFGDFKGTARCKCCKQDKGYTQDDSYLCDKTCTPDGKIYGDKWGEGCKCCSTYGEDGKCGASRDGKYSTQQFGVACNNKDYTQNGTIYTC